MFGFSIVLILALLLDGLLGIISFGLVEDDITGTKTELILRVVALGLSRIALTMLIILLVMYSARIDDD